MQVDQHIKNLRFLRAKVGKARTPKDHEKIGKEITEAIKKLGCNPNKIFYTTGRLTSEMVIKSVKMKIPVVISRSGFTAWGVELARKANLTLIGRAKGKKFIILSGEQRIDWTG